MIVRHSWLVAASRADLRRGLVAAAGDPILIDAHRNLRGPGTAAGALVLAFAARFGAAARAEGAGRLATLLPVCPGLRRLWSIPLEVERSLLFSREGNQPDWSWRSAHAIADFLLACLDGCEAEPVVAAFLGVDQADPFDREWLAVMLARCDPARLRIVVGTVFDDMPEPLRGALQTRADRRYCEPSGSGAPSVRSPRRLAQLYVESDCTLDDPAAVAVYAAQPPERRQALHRRQAERLEALADPASELGAIPLHRELEGRSAVTLAVAARRCMHYAFYESALDWARRAAHLAGQLGDLATRSAALRDQIFSLMLLGRHDEAEALCEQCLGQVPDAALHAHAAYAQAIMAARLRPAARQDYALARRCLERSLGFTSSLPASGARAANLSFLHNTLALVSLREGDADAASRLVTEAIDSLQREAPERFAKEAMILFHNRARLHFAAGRERDGLADLDRLLSLEPGNAEALFDRAVVHHKAARAADAVRDYDAATLWAPPQPETLLNRARLLAERGDTAAALRDYDHLLAMRPDHADGMVGRVELYWRSGRLEAARQAVEDALRQRPGEARLHCLAGLIALAWNRLEDAMLALDEAVSRDPKLADAFANRATVRWRQGRPDEALRDLERAMALSGDPAIGRNFEKVRAAVARAASSSPPPIPSRDVGSAAAAAA